MKEKSGHPEDLRPYLDANVSHPEFEGLRAHIESCGHCLEEARTWRTLNGLVRAHAPEIEVPPFQWQRIAARLSERPRPSRFVQLLASLRVHRLAWNAAVGAVLVAAITISGLEIHQYRQERALTPIAVYSEAEGRRLLSAENPFRGFVEAATDQNPFARIISEAGRSALPPPQ
ncbi:MAG: hypothetical protein ABIG68_13765 [Acidobacteriota bacterium]